MQKFIPYGLVNFRDIIEENYCPVDKILYVEVELQLGFSAEGSGNANL